MLGGLAQAAREPGPELFRKRPILNDTRQYAACEADGS